MPDKREIEDWLIARLAEVVNREPGMIDIREPFSNYGLSSVDAVALSGEMEDFIGRRLSPTITFDYPNIATLAKYLSLPAHQQTSSSDKKKLTGDYNEPIAVIGMSCRFPGANRPEEFWQLLSSGVDMIKEIPESRWPKNAFYHPDPSTPGKSVSLWGGFLDHVDLFDPHFFGISPIEAKHMDPQQRLLLELSYEAFDDAGQLKEQIEGSDTGVFVGISVNEYSQLGWNDPVQINSHTGTGSALSIAANRISYCFNLRGPSMVVDTACSSSLAAIHIACQNIRNGECEMAVAGGVNMILSPVHSIAFTKAGVLSPEGRCKAFDAGANGYVRGEGGGVILLKRLSSAVADGDTIHALILGSAMKQDGRTNGLIAPSSEGQEALLREAYKAAGISPGAVQYVEAHGTGTLLGDSMEAKALGNVIGADREVNFCSIGSVKTNIGHLEAAAGIAGLIKVILSMKHRALPPSLHYSSPNPHIPFDELNLKVNSRLTPWLPGSGPLLAGINSFGFGGTNVHMIVREADRNNEEKHASIAPAIPKPYLLPLSAGSLDGLRSLAGSFLKLLAPDSSIEETDVCYAAGMRRSQFDQRLAVMGYSKQELFNSLQSFLSGIPDPNIFFSNDTHFRQPKLAFVFSGQGGQWHGMASGLIKSEPVFYYSIQKIDRLIQQRFGWSLMDELLNPPSESRLDQIDIVQPAIFAIQVALADLWKSWGIIPDAVAGHSMGEVAAAQIAGSLSLEDAVNIICCRSKLLKSLSGKGRMVIAELSADQANEYIKKYDDDMAIGVINSPTSTVFSGTTEVINQLMLELEQQNIFCKQINVDVASHSPQIDQLQAEMMEVLKDTRSCPASMPYYSAVTGVKADNIMFDARYWFDNLRRPVLFSQTVSQLLDDGIEVFIEVGPHPVLLGSIQQVLKPDQQQVRLHPSLRRDEPEKEVLFKTLGALYSMGFAIAWKNLYPDGKKNLPLPPIPWQRQRYWFDLRDQVTKDAWRVAHSKLDRTHPILGTPVKLADSTGTIVWQNVLDTDALVFFKDHRIDHEIVFPAAGYIEMALQAANEIRIHISHELCDLSLTEIFIIRSGEPASIQAIMTRDQEYRFRFSVYGRSHPDDKWILHASASFIEKKSVDPEFPGFTADHALGSQTQSGLSVEDLYQRLESLGVQYGDSFRLVQTITGGNNKFSARVRLPDTMQYDAGSYQIHPALLDGCLQVIAAIQPAPFANDLYLPIGCQYIRFYSKPGQVALLSHVSIHSDLMQQQDSFSADFILSDETGNIIAELIGFSFKRTGRRNYNTLAQQDTWMYHVHWKPNDKDDFSISLKNKRHWLVFDGGEGLGSQLKMHLESRGDSCHLSDRSGIFNGAGNDSWDERVGSIENLMGSMSASLDGIVYLWDNFSRPDNLGTPGPIRETVANCNGVVSLVQALTRRIAGIPRLWIITKGAQQINEEEAVIPEQTTLWGLGKSIRFELPDIRCISIDLDPLQSDAENVQMLFRQITTEDTEDQVAFRNNIRYVQRLLPFTPNVQRRLPIFSLRHNRSYLITGGLGGLGLQTAIWMVNRGARHIILWGRSEPSNSAMRVIEQLRNKGVEVVIVQADVSDTGKFKKVFARIDKQIPPLAGVVHAAGVLDDRSLLHLDAEGMKKVMAPKINGTWNLHLETMKYHLDFFVLFSSAVSVLGSPGQGNYAAASSYLDAMAHLRHHMGLPGISINWGPWAEVGLAAQVTEKLKSQNASAQHLVKVIELDRGLEILEQLLFEPVPQVMVLPFDLKNLIELYPTAADMPFLSEVRGIEKNITHRYARPKLRQQYVAPRNELEQKLAELWRQTLHIDNVGVHDSFFELGGDSVLAAQLLGLVQKTFGIRIHPPDVFKSFTIERLGEILEAEIINRIEQMSEEEAAGRLSKRN